MIEAMYLFGYIVGTLVFYSVKIAQFLFTLIFIAIVFKVGFMLHDKLKSARHDHPYIQAAKFLGIVLLIGAVIGALEYDGYRRADQAWQIKYDAEQKEATRKTMEETAKYNNLSQRIDMINRSHENEINALHADNLKLLNSGVRKRKVCQSPVPKNNGAGVVIEEAINESELSREFTEFIISDAYRADSVGLYADTAYDWITSLCKTDNVACVDISTDKPMDGAAQ